MVSLPSSVRPLPSTVPLFEGPPWYTRSRDEFLVLRAGRYFQPLRSPRDGSRDVRRVTVRPVKILRDRVTGSRRSQRSDCHCTPDDRCRRGLSREPLGVLLWTNHPTEPLLPSHSTLWFKVRLHFRLHTRMGVMTKDSVFCSPWWSI